MSTPSPYLNPLWPDAVWDVSGAFVDDLELVSFFDFCKRNLGFEPFHLVHGSPMCSWNSGRVVNHQLRENTEINNAFSFYKERGISVYLTFTNPLLQEEHMKNYTGNVLCRMAAGNNPTGRNGIILASNVLNEYIKKEYPQLRRISSILKITTEHGKGKLDAYKRLADEYDEIMVHPDDVLNEELLEKLEEKERYILLVNEYCIRNCPLRPLHYENMSRSSLDFSGHHSAGFEKRQEKNGCMSLFTQLTDAKRGILALNTPELSRLRELGFRHFKLQGRGHENASALVSDLLRLVLNNDGEDENAMHALSQRFLETTYSIKTL